MALMAALGLTITSCFSMSKRNPSSEYGAVEIQQILKDGFSLDGYDHTQTRDFGNSKISNEQVIHELAGRSIWFKSAPNERHHTYVFPQKIGVSIDWSQAFLASTHNTRFQTWGVINDPDCCKPGETCEQKNMKFNGRPVTLADTYGWEYCAGDESLLNALKQNKVSQYQDPACEDPIIKAADSLSNQIRENRCELKFGTSAGAVGFRKYPNPRFNAKRWEKIGGYKTYSEKMIREGINSSIQPPFRVATACAACHAAFDPLNPPVDTTNPSWANIKGETGNQYLNVSKLMANGMRENTLETQLFTHTRPGTVDTSAVPHDFINNAGTMNAIINLPSRPLFKDEVLRWSQVDSCSVSETCKKVAYKNEKGQIIGYKFWSWSKSQIEVPHILKGGEDSVGYDLAVQRVYVNIGMCSEQCWQNNLTNLRELDFTSRGYGQGVFNIGQCREQCSAFRANEDRTPDIISYLVSRRPTDLKDALKNVKSATGEPIVPASKNKALQNSKFEQFLEAKYGVGSIARGKVIFASTCATCHSSQNNNSKENLSANETSFEGTDFFAMKTLDTDEVIRADWLGNDKSTTVGEVGTYACRALHTNHKRGYVWDQFSSESYKKLDPGMLDTFEKKVSGGPGFYRNISLLNVWAHAPFMHHNGIGPEICGNVDMANQVVKTSVAGRQMDATGKYKCDAYFDPSVAGRLDLYDKSMDELLTPPDQRRKKITLIDVPVKYPLGIRDMYLEFPAGIPLNTIANFDIKGFLYDFTAANGALENSGIEAFNKYWQAKFSDSPQKAQQLSDAVKSLIDSLNSARGLIELGRQVKAQDVRSLKVIANFYKTCDVKDEIENGGHNIGTTLSQSDQQALKAFMATF
jgi:hypothetical protein